MFKIFDYGKLVAQAAKESDLFRILNALIEPEDIVDYVYDNYDSVTVDGVTLSSKDLITCTAYDRDIKKQYLESFVQQMTGKMDGSYEPVARTYVSVLKVA